MGRFMSPDWSAKIMPVPYAKLDNPQSLNLYAYVGNNPLTRFDPDGHTVPDSCAKDKSCQITVKVNVIWDQSAHKGNGLTKDEKANYQKNQLDTAKRDCAKSGINLEFSYTNKGGYTSDGQVSTTGLKADSLNLIVSTGAPDGPPGQSGITDTGIAISFVGIPNMKNTNWLMDGNTTELELAHQFNGDTYKQRTGSGKVSGGRMSQAPFFEALCGSLRCASLSTQHRRRCAIKSELRSTSVGTKMSGVVRSGVWSERTKLMRFAAIASLNSGSASA